MQKFDAQGFSVCGFAKYLKTHELHIK